MTVIVFVPDVPEYRAVVEAAKIMEGCVLYPSVSGYWRIDAESGLRFERKKMALGPALWNSMLCGGFRGRIVEYSRDVLRIESDAQRMSQ